MTRFLSGLVSVVGCLGGQRFARSPWGAAEPFNLVFRFCTPVYAFYVSTDVEGAFRGEKISRIKFSAFPSPNTARLPDQWEVTFVRLYFVAEAIPFPLSLTPTCEGAEGAPLFNKTFQQRHQHARG